MRTDEINVMLIAAVVGWVAAQVIKTFLYFIETKKFNGERLFGAGGMPSSHSATVCALTVTASRVCGINSPEFALCMVFALVVMYDACGVRRAAGLHAREINRLRRIVDKLDDELLDHLEEEIDIEIDEEETKSHRDLKEFLGHTPFQVMCGALLGIIIGLIFNLLIIVA